MPAYTDVHVDVEVGRAAAPLLWGSWSLLAARYPGNS